jgi:hypothetical protein
MTLDVYADLFDEDFDGVADRLDAAIRSTADQLRKSSVTCAEYVLALLRQFSLSCEYAFALRDVTLLPPPIPAQPTTDGWIPEPMPRRVHCC